MIPHLNMNHCDRPFPHGPGYRGSFTGLHGVAADVEALATLAQTIADDLCAASCRMDLHATDSTGDAALSNPEDVVAYLAQTRAALALLAPLARAMREASR